MIVVLADDYSGAAEIAGIAHRFGFETKLITEYGDISKTEILVIDTDTRSCSQETAIKKLKNIITMISNIEIEWMYKKVDSVLRGHVLAEINQILDETNFTRAILVPANPSKGRKIKNGTYFIEGYTH